MMLPIKYAILLELLTGLLAVEHRAMGLVVVRVARVAVAVMAVALALVRVTRVYESLLGGITHVKSLTIALKFKYDLAFRRRRLVRSLDKDLTLLPPHEVARGAVLRLPQWRRLYGLAIILLINSKYIHTFIGSIIGSHYF